MEIAALYVSSGHNYFGRHGRVALSFEILEVDEIQCIASKGIMGDRFFEYKPNYRGQITLFSEEVYTDLVNHLGVYDKSPAVLRRNIITRRADLNRLIGVEFEIQGIRFEGIEECKPCYWMDQAFGAGAEKALRGRGGLRARILTSGRLQRTALVAAE